MNSSSTVSPPRLLCSDGRETIEEDSLRQYSFHQFSMDIRQAVVPSLEFVSQSFVVYAENVEQGRVQVVHMHRVFGDIITIFVSRSESDALFYSSPGQENGETTWVVITPVVGFGKRALPVNGATEFTSPDDQGIF